MKEDLIQWTRPPHSIVLASGTMRRSALASWLVYVMIPFLSHVNVLSDQSCCCFESDDMGQTLFLTLPFSFSVFIFYQVEPGCFNLHLTLSSLQWDNKGYFYSTHLDELFSKKETFSFKCSVESVQYRCCTWTNTNMEQFRLHLWISWRCFILTRLWSPTIS